MKRMLLLACSAIVISCTSLMAQSTTFGVRGGVNFYNLNGKDSDGDKVDGKLRTGFNVGANVEIPVGIDFYVQPGLLFQMKGAKAKDFPTDISLSYLEIPVNFIYKPELGSGRVILGFGPYAAYAVGGKFKLGSQEEDIEFGDQPGELKRFDAGANFLAGYEFSNKLSFQLNAGLGLLNIANRPDGDDESSVKNTGFGVSLGYRF